MGCVGSTLVNMVEKRHTNDRVFDRGHKSGGNEHVRPDVGTRSAAQGGSPTSGCSAPRGRVPRITPIWEFRRRPKSSVTAVGVSGQPGGEWGGSPRKGLG